MEGWTGIHDDMVAFFLPYHTDFPAGWVEWGIGWGEIHDDMGAFPCVAYRFLNLKEIFFFFCCKDLRAFRCSLLEQILKSTHVMTIIIIKTIIVLLKIKKTQKIQGSRFSMLGHCSFRVQITELGCRENRVWVWKIGCWGVGVEDGVWVWKIEWGR